MQPNNNGLGRLGYVTVDRPLKKTVVGLFKNGGTRRCPRHYGTKKWRMCVIKMAV